MAKLFLSEVISDSDYKQKSQLFDRTANYFCQLAAELNVVAKFIGFRSILFPDIYINEVAYDNAITSIASHRLDLLLLLHLEDTN